MTKIQKKASFNLSKCMQLTMEYCKTFRRYKYTLFICGTVLKQIEHIILLHDLSTNMFSSTQAIISRPEYIPGVHANERHHDTINLI